MTRAHDAGPIPTPVPRGDDLPAQQRPGADHPTAVGWWRPPKNRRPGQDDTPAARHRAPGIGTGAGVARPTSRGRGASAGPPRRGRSRPPFSARAGRRVTRTPQERRRLLLRIALWSLAVTVAMSVIALVVGYALAVAPDAACPIRSPWCPTPTAAS